MTLPSAPPPPASAAIPPGGQDSFPERLRRINAQIVRTTLLASLAGALIAAGILAMQAAPGAGLFDIGNQRILNGIIIAGVACLCLLLQRRGLDSLASALFGLFLLVFFLAASVWLQNGAHSVGLQVIIVVILLAGFLFHPRMALWVAVGCALAIIALLAAQTLGILQIIDRNKPPAGVIVLVMVIIYLLVGWMTYRYASLFRDSLAGLEHTKSELEQSIGRLQEREQQLMAANRLADQANQAKSTFLATMSHEIRTPMNGVLGMAHLLQEPGLSETQRISYAQTIHQSGSLLLSILNDILDWSKIEAGRMELEQIAFSPADALRDVHAMFGPAAREKGLSLTLILQTDGPSHVQGDPTRLRQILMNLTGNAIKFTPHGSVTLALTVSDAGPQSAQLTFSVRDTGIGILPEQRDRLFQPFSQADGSTTRRFGGTGLGLAIVQRFVSLMGGAIHLESQPGQGTHFWFELNLPVAQPPVQPGSIAANRHTGTLRGKVLLAEDMPVNQLVARGMLARHGLEVVCVEDGQAAVDAICSGAAFDLVLMDCQMPELGGIDATRIIREWEQHEQRPAIPIIALTAGAFEEDREQCLAAGMNDFLSKPIVADILLAAVQRWLPTPGHPQVDQADA